MQAEEAPERAKVKVEVRDRGVLRDDPMALADRRNELGDLRRRVMALKEHL